MSYKKKTKQLLTIALCGLVYASASNAGYKCDCFKYVNGKTTTEIKDDDILSILKSYDPSTDNADCHSHFQNDENAITELSTLKAQVGEDDHSVKIATTTTAVDTVDVQFKPKDTHSEDVNLLSVEDKISSTNYAPATDTHWGSSNFQTINLEMKDFTYTDVTFDDDDKEKSTDVPFKMSHAEANTNYSTGRDDQQSEPVEQHGKFVDVLTLAGLVNDKFQVIAICIKD